MGNAGAREAGADGGSLEARSALYGRLADGLGCPDDVAIEMARRFGADERAALRELVRRGAAARRAPGDPLARSLRDRLRRSRHAKQFDALQELGVPEADAAQVLRAVGYDELKALRTLVREHFAGLRAAAEPPTAASHDPVAATTSRPPRPLAETGSPHHSAGPASPTMAPTAAPSAAPTLAPTVAPKPLGGSDSPYSAPLAALADDTKQPGNTAIPMACPASNLESGPPPQPPQRPARAHPPPIVERPRHNALMLERLAGINITDWNPELIRSLGKWKQLARSARTRTESSASTGNGSGSETGESGSRDDAGAGTASPTSPGSPPARAGWKQRPRHDVSLLQERLDNFGLGELVMQGDGNCQFRSVSYELFRTQDHHMHVRQRAVKYMRENPEQFSLYFEATAEFEAYVDEMSLSGTWGDELTLKALAEAFRLSVHVLTSTEGFGGYNLAYIPESASQGKAPIHYNVATHKNCEERRRHSRSAISLLHHASFSEDHIADQPAR